MNYCVYMRVSTDKQDVSSQEKAIADWLAEKHLSEGDVTRYRDEGWSGAKAERPGLKAMLEACYSGHHHTIVVYRLDRFSRDANTAIRTIIDLDTAGVAFVSVSQPALNLAHEVPFRRTMLAAFAEIAEIERETIVARIKAGMAAARARGQHLGNQPKVTQLQREKIVELRRLGLTYKKIGRAMKLSHQTCWRVLREEMNGDAEASVVPDTDRALG